MNSELVSTAGSIEDLPPYDMCISQASTADLPGIALAYQAGSALRSSHEVTDRWAIQGSYTIALAQAQRNLDGGDLYVNRLKAPDYTFTHPAYVGPMTATAIIRHDDEADVELWEGFGSSEAAMYVHRLATHPDYTGQRRGEALLASIAYSSMCHEEVRPLLRLDCAAEATKLRDYYERRIGLLCIGETFRQSNGYHAALYEGRIREIVPANWWLPAPAEHVQPQE